MFQVKALQAVTKVIVSAALVAASVVPSQSKELLCCCGEYLLLLTSGNTHALIAAVLKICSVCFSAMPHNCVDGERRLCELLEDAGAKLLNSAAQIVHSVGGESNKKFSAQLLDVMHYSLPLVHAPDSHMLHILPEGRSIIVPCIDGALQSLCVQPALLQHAVQELLSASSQQGLAQFVGEHSSECQTDSKMSEAAEATESDLPHRYLENALFTPWEWLEQTANAVVLQPWQQAMVACLPQHAYWMVGLCSTTPDISSRQEVPSGRAKRMRGGADAKQLQAMRWSAFLAVLHRSAMTVRHILRCSRKPGKKGSKSSKKHAKQNSGTAMALHTSLEVCAMVIRACGDHQVPSSVSL